MKVIRLLVTVFLIQFGSSSIAAPIIVSGYVSNNGLPAKSYTVSFSWTARGIPDTTYFTDTNGIYNLTINPSLTSGTLEVWMIDCRNDTITNNQSFSPTTTTIRADLIGCPRTPQNLLLNGFVSNKPANLSSLFVYFSLNNFGSVFDSALVDSLGSYSKVLQVQTQGQISFRLTNCKLQNLTDSFFYRAPDTITKNFDYCPASVPYFGTIRFRGRPIQNSQAEVLALRYNSTLQSFEKGQKLNLTDSAVYRILNDSTSDFLIKVIPSDTGLGWVPTYYPKGKFWDADNAQSIGQHKTGPFDVDLISISPHARAGNSVSGKIDVSSEMNLLDFDQLPLMAINEAGQIVQSILPDQNGTFQFENLPDGKFQIWLDYIGLPTQPYEVVLSGKTLDQNVVITVNTQGVSYDSYLDINEDVAEVNEPSVFPNPFQNTLNIRNAESFELKNLNGQVVLQESQLPTEHLIQNELLELKPGIYFLELSQGESKFHLKLIHQ